MPEPLLQVQGLVKHFPAGGWPKRRVVHAVDGVSFALYRGETLGLVGESGSGKTTVGRCILRLLEPTAGRILFDTRDITRLSGREWQQLRRRMQMVFQDPAGSLNPRFTTWRTLSEPYLRFHLLPKRDIRPAVIELLTNTGLQPADLDKYPHNFSGGQQQRIAVARALAPRPDLIVLDEPTASLDVSVRMQVIDLLERLQRDFDLSYLFISHDLSIIRHISHRTAVMYLGQLVEIGPTQELFRSPLHPYTRALLAAAPVPDPSLRRVRVALPGEVPSAINPPPGCRFHPRCELASSRCRCQAPELFHVSPSREVACHLAGDGLLEVGPVT